MTACESLTPSWILVCSVEAVRYTQAGATVTGGCLFRIVKRCDASLVVYVVEFVDSSIVRTVTRRRASAS